MEMKMEEREEQYRRHTLAIRWVRAKMKEYYPGGGPYMTAALNLWHVLRESPHRHGCGFDDVFSYQWATRKMLEALFNEGLVEEAHLEPLWDALIRQLKVSHTPPENAPDYWKKFPTFKKKEIPPTPAAPAAVEKKRGFFGRLFGK